MYILLYLLLLFKTSFGIITINLNVTNNIILRGTINEESVSRTIYEINKIINKNEIYLILDTVGGEVFHGMELINELENHNINCIVQKAYSMGFALLQACNKRYILPHSTVMQHQMSMGLAGEIGKIQSSIILASQYEYYLTNLQSNRINIDPNIFKNKINNEWWSFGSNIINENIADEMIYISCSPSLTILNYTINKGNYEITYSSCPLITKELFKEKKKKSDPFSFLFI